MFNVPVSGYRLNVGLSELAKVNEVNNRRLYLFGEILSVDSCEDEFDPYVSPTSMLVKQILSFNKADIGLAPAKREPIILYINSPGGELIEGFPLIVSMLASIPKYDKFFWFRSTNLCMTDSIDLSLHFQLCFNLSLDQYTEERVGIFPKEYVRVLLIHQFPCFF